MVRCPRYRHTLCGVSVFVLTSTLTACGRTGDDPGTTPPTNPPTPAPKVLSGTAEDWIGRAASLRAESYTPGVTVAETPINADGSFSLVLPAGEEMAQFLDSFHRDSYSCEDRGATGAVEIAPDPLKLAEVSRLIVYTSVDEDAPELGSLYHQASSTDAEVSVTQMYAASAGSIKGSCTETFETDDGLEMTRTDIYDIDLVAGWNEVSYVDRFSEDGRYRISTIASTSNAPATVYWVYAENNQ